MLLGCVLAENLKVDYGSQISLGEFILDDYELVENQSA